jgi:hypothetical protein
MPPLTTKAVTFAVAFGSGRRNDDRVAQHIVRDVVDVMRDSGMTISNGRSSSRSPGCEER